MTLAARDDLEFALHLASEAGVLAMRWFSSSELKVNTKRDRSPVTQADRAIESRLRELVESADPSSGIVGEEEGRKPSRNRRCWYFDPIDGTEAFVHGVQLSRR